MDLTSLNDIIDRNTIMCGLAAETKDDVFVAMSQRLFEQGYVASAEDFVTAVYEREKEGVTGIGSHVAIPHGKSSTVLKSGVAIAVLDHEIEWESLDETGAKVVVLLTVEEAGSGASDHLKMLALFARKMASQQVIDALLAAESVNDVVAVFTE